MPSWRHKVPKCAHFSFTWKCVTHELLPCVCMMYINTTLCLKKTVQNCFCQKFVKCLPTLIIFLHTESTEDRFMWGAVIFHLTQSASTHYRVKRTTFALPECQKSSKLVEIWDQVMAKTTLQFFLGHGVFSSLFHWGVRIRVCECWVGLYL